MSVAESAVLGVDNVKDIFANDPRLSTISSVKDQIKGPGSDQPLIMIVKVGLAVTISLPSVCRLHPLPLGLWSQKLNLG